VDTKGHRENLVSENLQSKKYNRLTERRSMVAIEEEKSQSPLKRTYADVVSPLKGRKSMARMSEETCGHTTICNDYLTEKWVSTEGIYMDQCAYSGRHVNATTQEIER